MKEEFSILCEFQRGYDFKDEHGKQVNGTTRGFAIAFFKGGAACAERVEIVKASRQADYGKLCNQIGKRITGTLVFDRFGRLCSIC